MNSTGFMKRSLIIASAWLATPGLALTIGNDLQVHGFASQAFLKSEGNNIYGDSLDGSTDFMEAGLNANYRHSSRLYVAGQVISRDAGNTDNGDINLDYLFADYKLGENDQSGIGARIGRVRNSYGFYNDTRDVVFTRPTILMPQAVYFEGNGLREFLFSSDGLQLYGYWDEAEHSTNFSFSVGKDKSLPQDSLDIITGGSGMFRNAEIKNPVYAQLLHSRNGGQSRYALSTLNLTLRADGARSPIPSASIDASGVVLSAERNFLDWALTAEYSFVRVEGYLGSTQNQDAESKTFYLQARRHLANNLVATLRYEHGSYEDKELGSLSNSKHWVAGLQWTPDISWLLALDIYSIKGAGGIPAIDNRGREEDKHTTLLAAMIAYRF
ncbi:hypothetical protein NCG89_02565 [Spongiibacter taiwanensis]|uniref:hypothetical protein n=1 Tax=Spongiibacter taiwanensis TaxID=1748242 RepID=UPI002034AF36|nr:hypothetical protein [Spongiibacter taiwanensis]USA43678.1 hypothetical protein NCG89_02565 [Spongiibacter taiwanensis]